MQQMKIILIVLLMTLTVDAKWKELKSYGPKVYTLKKGVEYVEIRISTYSMSREAGAQSSTSVQTALKFYRKPLSAFGAKIAKKFKQIPVKKQFAFNKGYESHMLSGSDWYYNGFMLDSAGKSWRLENAQDVIDMIKPIDTPAELGLVLWLDPKIHGSDSTKYQKSGSGYIVRSHYVIHDTSEGECGDYTYQYRVSRSGKLTKKLLRKKEVDDCGSE